MAADARLALPQHLCQFTDRQFHRAQQCEDAQPRRVGKRAEDIEGQSHNIFILETTYKDIFI